MLLVKGRGGEGRGGEGGENGWVGVGWVGGCMCWRYRLLLCFVCRSVRTTNPFSSPSQLQPLNYQPMVTCPPHR